MLNACYVPSTVLSPLYEYHKLGLHQQKYIVSQLCNLNPKSRPARSHPLWNHWGILPCLFLAFSGLQQSLELFGLQPYNWELCLCRDMVSSLCLSLFTWPSFCKDTSHTPGWLLSLLILSSVILFPDKITLLGTGSSDFSIASWHSLIHNITYACTHSNQTPYKCLQGETIMSSCYRWAEGLRGRLENLPRDFPSSPVGQCVGCGFEPWSGNWDLTCWGTTKPAHLN